jgi:hypothetical protein
MPLDNTDVAPLSTLGPLAPLQATDIIPIYRPGSATPLQTARVADVGAALGGAMTVENQGVTTTTTPQSLNFTSGILVTDDGFGHETISTPFASVKDYGAVGDGVANDAPAFTAAAAAGVTVFIPLGTYKLSSSVAFPHQVVFLTGATIAPASGTTTAFNGGIEAPPAAIFSLTGSAVVSFDPRTQLAVLAEWWGASPYAASAYPVATPTWSDAAIQAAVNAGAAAVQLMGGDYYIEAAIDILNSYTVLRGAGASLNQVANGATRIVIKSATIDGIVIGASSKPGGSGTTNWIDHVRLENLTVIRTTKPTSLNGNVAGSPSGVRLRWALQCTIRGVTSQDHSNGFYITGTASCIIRDCWAERSLADNGSGWDYWQGFSQDNSPSSGFNSGNASLYHLQNAVHNGAGAFSNGTWGLCITGGFSDTYLDGFETALVAIGIEADGKGTSGTTAVAENLQIVNSVVDASTSHGILIYNTNSVSQVRIANCYMAPTSGDCLTFNAFKGVASVTGNQLFGTNVGITGLRVTGNSLGVSSVNNMITDCQAPVVFDDAGMCRCQDVITQGQFSVTSASVWLTNSTFRCVVNPIVNGVSSGQSGIGVKVDSGVGYCAVDPSGMNAGALLSGSSANKIVYNGTQVTSAGAFGTTNLASGIFG